MAASCIFLLSAASASDFPQTGLPEIALVGRSNVGKSSLINALVAKTIARTSAAPGKTRLANYYLIDPAANPESQTPNPKSRSSFYLVDLPGYGYARGGDRAAEEFDVLTKEYFDSRGTQRRLAGVLHVIDARHPELAQDLDAHRWVAQTGLPVAVVATKLDKLKQSDRAVLLRLLADQYDTEILTTSSADGTGLKDLWQLLRSWAGHAQ